MAIASKAASANKLNTNAGSSTVPVYFTDGKPVAITSYNGNAATASQLKTARTIQLAGGAIKHPNNAVLFDGTKNISLPLGSIYASFLDWGGRTIVGDISPIDAAMSYLHSPNRLQFANPKGIIVEYSNDGGATWVDYGATDGQKINFVSGIGNQFYYGKHSNGVDRTIKDQLRITINASDCEVYTNLKTVLINFSSGGQTGTQVFIESAKRGSETNFNTSLGTYDISGWSGWNSYPLAIGAFGGGNKQTSNTGALRFTFSFTALNNTYAQTPQVINIIFLGTTGWSTPSDMANTGHIYAWDSVKNAIFRNGGVRFEKPYFNYSGIETGTTNQDRVVWFADVSYKGKPVYNDNFTYNPSTKILTVGAISGVANGGVSGKLSINGKIYNGSSSVDVGTIGIGNGGTGATTKAQAIDNLIRRSFPTSKDFNDCVELGTYTWGGQSELNSPIANSYGTIVNLTSNNTQQNKKNNWIWQFACSTEGSNSIYIRQAVNSSDFTEWSKFITSTNYTNYTVTKDGTGATGTWNIAVTSADHLESSGNKIYISNNTYPFVDVWNANGRQWGIEGVPSSNAARVHFYTNGTWKSTHWLLDDTNYSNYALPLTGGTMSGSINFNNVEAGSQTAGINWAGSSDYAKIFYYVPNSDEGHLVLDVGDDDNASVVFCRNGTTTTEYAFGKTWFDVLTADTHLYKGLYVEGVSELRGEVNITGTALTIQNANSSGYAQLLEDTEGGTLRLASANGKYTYEIDAAGNDQLRLHTANSGQNQFLYWNGGTGLLTAQDIVVAGSFNKNNVKGTLSADSQGAGLLCTAVSSNTGIYCGNGDSGAEILGTSGTANLFIKSWYGVGFVDGGTGAGMTVGINCRTGKVTANSVYGAVWNDYAEYRQASIKEPGRCVVEKGDDTLELSTARLLPGANIVSDTFGFAIGETKDCATPIAVSGRVLAYPYEPRDQFKAGDAVCSGPNGTVSIMTREEIKEYPERIIGTVSSVPAYEKWGSGDVQVNGRIWIKVK